MIMCVLCYPVSIHMSQLLSTGRPISSSELVSHVILVFHQLFSVLFPADLWCLNTFN